MDITGQRFGRWIAVSFAHAIPKSGTLVVYWNCRCDCGIEKPVNLGTLRNGTSISCGKCGSKKTNRRTHGLSPRGKRATEYDAWAHMLQRCENPNSDEFTNYGARGITVCDEWHSFKDFLVSMGFKPSPRHSLERVDNNKGYSPNNCKWATTKEQSRNHRRNRWIEWNGQRKLITEWSKELGGRSHSLYTRLKRGWSIERAMTTPF